MKLLFLFLNCLTCSFTLVLNGQSTRRTDRLDIPVEHYQLAWSDEFSGDHLDRNKWQYSATGVRRNAINRPENISLDGHGHLMIQVSQYQDKIYAGMIDTDQHFNTRYGYFECRAKLTRATGIWPAFWLLSSNNVDGGNPEQNGAEIDIFEFFGNITRDSVAHTLHWGGYRNTHKVVGPAWGALQPTKDGFHRFGLEWTPESYTTYVDGIQTSHITSQISKMPEFIILSTEVDDQVAGALNRQQLPDVFTVDYVRVYKKL